MNHFYRALTLLLCFMVFHSFIEAKPPIEQEMFTLCADRTASNTERCMNDDYQNTRYGGYILFEGLDNHYRMDNGRFQEFLDGTARFTGRWVNIERSDVNFDVDIEFSGRTTNAPNDPKEHRCFNVSGDDFYYYTQLFGTLKGRERVVGANLEVSRFGEAFQIGIGANVTNKDLNFGASGWLAIRMISQPSTGFHLNLQTSQAGGNGDININLSGDRNDCLESKISLECPPNITTVAQLGANGKVVSWNPPTATTTCMVGDGNVCPPNNLDGYMFLGEYNGSKYYCSENNYTWLHARDRAMDAGGYLAVVCSAAENNFIRQGMSSLNNPADDAWIGFTDRVNEGDFNWVTGENCNYTNWRSGEPNNHGGDEHFTRFLRSSGEWTDRDKDYKAEFILEIPCQNNMEEGEVIVTQIQGPASGSLFPFGTTTVKYEAIDECGNMEMCSFTVTVEEPVDPCAGNGSPTASVDGQDPDCGQTNGKIVFNFEDSPNRSIVEFSSDGGQTFPLNVPDNAGMAMFGNLGPGTYELVVRWGDNNCPVDLGTIILNDTRLPAGTQCDDRNDLTLNDVIQADGCTCEGIPTGEITLVCEDDIAEIAEPGANGVVVTYNEPTANTNCGLGGLNVDRIEGPASGSLFPIGTTTVKYRVTDACGNMEMCSFDIVIEETPLFLDIVCGDDIEVTAAVRENGAIVNFNDPSILTNCPADGFTVEIIEGLASGSLFPVGMTTVTFKVTDGCNQMDECSIKVTVNPAPTGDITLVCNDNIEVTAAIGENSAVVNYNEPTAETTCILGGLVIERIEGPASGSEFPVGITLVVYEAMDACGEMERCSIKVTVNPAPTGDITLICNDDIEVTAEVGANSEVVSYNEPTASTTCILGGLVIERIEGPASGSEFPVGMTTIVYEAMDACGEMERCSIKVTVNPAPTGDITLICNDDIDVIAALGDDGAVVNYIDPTASTTCPLGGLEVERVLGPASGEKFPIGETEVAYLARDACGETKRCVFLVSVIPTIEPCINAIEITNKVCDDNGTPTDPKDDTYTFDVIGIGGGSAANSYVGSYDNAFLGAFAFTADYGEVVTLGPFPAGTFTSSNTQPPVVVEGGLDINVSITDANDSDCQSSVLVESTGPCSDEKVKVGDFVFLDANGNGLKEDTEGGIRGVYVGLYDGIGNLLDFILTDDNGMYMFPELDAGDYQLKFMGQPDDLIPTLQDEGDDDKIDSDIDETGFTEVFTLVSGFDDTRDAGFKPRTVEPDPARIGNQVFLDGNGNGVKEDNEPGIDGVEVKLLDGINNIVATTTTGNNGMYGFSVDAGTYKVMFGTPFGFVATNQSGNATDGIDNDSDNDPTTGMTELFTVAAGEFNATIDAGFVEAPESCLADAGTLTIDQANVELVGGSATISATPNSDENVPNGFSRIYVLTKGADLVIEQVSDNPSFVVDMEGKYTIHTLVYDVATLDLNIVVFGLTTSGQVNSLLIQGSGDICASLDVAGAMVMVMIPTDEPVDCDAVEAEVSDGKVTVSGLEGINAKVEIIGAGTNWIPILICGDGGDACSNPQMITDLPEGDYTVKIQLWGANGSYCYTERRIKVEGGDPGCEAEGGRISTDDRTERLCVNDGEEDIIDFVASGGNGTNRAWVVTDENGTILNPDAPSSINFEGAGEGTCYVYYLRHETIEGLSEGNNINNLSGCFDLSNRIGVSRTENCGGGEPQCEDVEVTTGNNKINLVGLAGQWVVVKVHDVDNGWIIVEECFGCEDPTTFTVPEGNYMVVIEFYRGVWTDKYCRRDVPVTVGGGDPCTDNDGDGVCAEDDCDDNNGAVGAKQPQGTACDDGNASTINDQIQSDGCTCAGEEETDREICADRGVFNTDNCQFNIFYGLYLKLDGYDEYYEVSDANFIEYTDGTALFTATAVNNTSPEIGWEIEVNFGDRTTLAVVSPKEHNCLEVDISDHYFYESLTGTLNGINSAEGAQLNITRIGPAFQLGIGANITHNDYDFGGSGWFVADLISQPTSIAPFVLNAGAQGQNGDININLSGDGTECIDDRDNRELDCANVSAVVTPDGISITGLTAPIEIVKVFDANWAPIENCAGDCGDSRLVPAAPGNYLVRVNFYTAYWEGVCEVDIPVTVPASANSGASSRNAARLNINTFEDVHGVTVEWLTNTGYINESYVIEKSTDGRSFETLNKVENEDNSDELAYYKGQDVQPTLGANYYRIKQIYVDGSFDYSEVQLVNFDLDLQELAVFPNPAKEELFVSLKAHAGKQANLQIVNTFGHIVQQYEFDEIPQDALRLDIGKLQNGIYHLSIQVDNAKVVTKKVLVNRLY